MRNKRPVGIWFSVSVPRKGPAEARAFRGGWIHLATQSKTGFRFVFCTRTSTGTNNAVVETHYYSSAEYWQSQPQRAGLRPEVTEKIERFLRSWLHRHPLLALSPALHRPCRALSPPHQPVESHNSPVATSTLVVTPAWTAGRFLLYCN